MSLYFDDTEQLQNGNPSAFNHILDNYEKPLINYLYRYLGSRQDAEDIAQETFIKVYFAITKGKYRANAKLSSYIYRIATNLSLNLLRRRKIIKFLSLDFSGDDGEEEPIQIRDVNQKDPAETFNEEGKIRRVKKAIQKLPHFQRSAIILFYYEEKSYQEIAKILKKSVSSVESLIFRAKKNLERFLKI